MAKSKRKPAPQPIGDFTDQIRAAEYAEVRTATMPGERGRVALHTRRKQCAALRWGWLTKEQQAALVLFEDARDYAGLDTVRSALCPPTGGDGARPERVAIKRERFQTMCEAIRNKLAMALADEALRNPDRETLDQIADRWFGGRRQHNRESLECWIASVADDILAWREAGERLPERLPVAIPVNRVDAFEQWAQGVC
jgi:hypothetical protein